MSENNRRFGQKENENRLSVPSKYSVRNSQERSMNQNNSSSKIRTPRMAQVPYNPMVNKIKQSVMYVTQLADSRTT